MKLTQKILDTIKGDEVVYAESAEPDAYGDSGTVRIYIMRDGKLYFYLVRLNEFGYSAKSASNYKLYDAAQDFLYRLALDGVLRQIDGGYGNSAFRGRRIKLQRNDDEGDFIYAHDGQDYKIKTSCLGVYCRAAFFFADRKISLERLKKQLDRHQDKFSDDEFAFLVAYVNRCEAFDHGQTTSDLTASDYYHAMQHIRYLNKRSFNFSNDSLNRNNYILQRYRLQYVLDKIGWNRLHDFVAKYFERDKDSEVFFQWLDELLGEKIEEKSTTLPTITPVFSGDAATLDHDLFDEGLLMELFKYPVLVDFSPTSRQLVMQIIQDMDEETLQKFSRSIGCYIVNYCFQDTKLSYAEILPTALHIARTVPTMNHYGNDVAHLYWLAGEVINNAWCALDDTKLEEQFCKLIYPIYWSRVDDLWPIKHYDEFKFEEPAVMHTFDEALGFIFSVPKIQKYNPKLANYLKSDQATNTEANIIRKGIFKIKYGHLNDEAFEKQILQNLSTFEAIRVLSYPESIKTAKFYLADLFREDSIMPAGWKISAFEQLLLASKRKKVGKYILETIVKRLSEFYHIVTYEAALSMFTAACSGATEPDELEPLRDFAELLEVVCDEHDDIHAALALAQENVNTTQFQRHEVTKFLNKQ